MKVKDMLEQLKQFDESAEVYVSGCDGDYMINHVEKDNNGDAVIC